MQIHFVRRAAGFVIGGLMAQPSAHAIEFTIEAPGVQQTTTAGTLTESFDTVAAGALGTYLSPIGTFTGGQIVSPDIFGGANASRYDAVGAQSGTLLGTLTFGTGKTYFGLWWSALDGQNQLLFYDSSASLLGSFRSSDITPSLSAAYFSNPNGGANAGEAYVYLNFAVTSGPPIQQVHFRNDTASSGFEIDNLSVLAAEINPPNIAVSEGASPFWLLIGTVTVLFFVRNGSRMLPASR